MVLCHVVRFKYCACLLLNDAADIALLQPDIADATALRYHGKHIVFFTGYNLQQIGTIVCQHLLQRHLDIVPLIDAFSGDDPSR